MRRVSASSHVTAKEIFEKEGFTVLTTNE